MSVTGRNSLLLALCATLLGACVPVNIESRSLPSAFLPLTKGSPSSGGSSSNTGGSGNPANNGAGNASNNSTTSGGTNANANNSGAAPNTVDHLLVDTAPSGAVSDCVQVTISARNAAGALTGPDTPLLVFASAEGGVWNDGAGCSQASATSSWQLTSNQPSVQKYLRYTKPGAIAVQADGGPGGPTAGKADVTVAPKTAVKWVLRGPQVGQVAHCYLFDILTVDEYDNAAAPGASSDSKLTAGNNVGLFPNDNCTADPGAPYGYGELDLTAEVNQSSGQFSMIPYAAGTQSVTVTAVSGPITTGMRSDMQVSTTCGAQAPLTQLSGLQIDYSNGGLHVSIKSGSAILYDTSDGNVAVTDRRTDRYTPDYSRGVPFRCVGSYLIDAAAANTSATKLVWLGFSNTATGAAVAGISRIVDMSASSGPVQILGSPYNDAITGSPYSDNIFSGISGSKVIHGGAGRDIFFMGFGNAGETESVLGEADEDDFWVYPGAGQINVVGGGPATVGGCGGDRITPIFSNPGNAMDFFNGVRAQLSAGCLRGAAEPAL